MSDRKRRDREAMRWAAEAAHEINRLWCLAHGDDSQPTWKDAPEWQRQSAIEGARAIIANPEMTPNESHEGWLALKKADGWVWGPVKDAEKKEHPCMLPYHDLPPKQRMKDFLFTNTVSSFIYSYVAANPITGPEIADIVPEEWYVVLDCIPSASPDLINLKWRNLINTTPPTEHAKYDRARATGLRLREAGR